MNFLKVLVGLVFVMSLSSSPALAKKKGLSAPKNEAELTKWKAEGKKIFTANCTSCHGDSGKGDTPVGKALNPHPRDLTSSDGWINGATADGIYQTIIEGIKGGSTGMVSFKASIKAKDHSKLVYFILSEFQKKSAKDLLK